MVKSTPTIERAAMGQDESALAPLSAGVYLHSDVIEPYRALAKAAQAQGFELRIASGYRSFARQLAIFNAKARGERAVLNDAGDTVKMDTLSDSDKLWAILRFSALPGTSRHHWGTDMDVFDRAAVPSEYQLQLTPAECCPDGVFAKLHQWLDDYLPGSAFFRPYSLDTGAVAPEPWHLSHAPTARQFSQQLSPERLARVLRDTDIALKDVVLENISTIYQRYVCV